MKEPLDSVSDVVAWRLCPDATGELADISCGDPWYRDVGPDDPGRSLVLVRTEAGRWALHEAMKTGCGTIKQIAPDASDDRTCVAMRGV